MTVTSIRSSLLRHLLVLYGAGWMVAVVSIYAFTRHEIEEIFDAQLAEASGVIEALALPLLQRNLPHALNLERPMFGHPYERMISFQVWEGEALLLKSRSAPGAPLARTAGYSERGAGSGPWRVFSRRSDDVRYLISTAESYAVRAELVRNVTLSALYPLLALLPLVAVATWFGIGRGLAPLARAAEQILARSRNAFDPLSFEDAPREIRPLTEAINDFLHRLGAAFERESRFTSDAAHELRTPLAAVKVQAQVALRAQDSAERERALHKVVEGIDNGTRLVEQMLTLARLDAPGYVQRFEDVELGGLAARVVEAMAPAAESRGFELCLDEAEPAFVRGAPVAIGILLRNLLDNAMQHSGAGCAVRVAIDLRAGRVLLSVEDRGPGIPEAERERVLERFYRRHAAGSGSGLGLSIVRRIVELHGATLTLGSGAESCGLRVVVDFPVAGVPVPG